VPVSLVAIIGHLPLTCTMMAGLFSLLAGRLAVLISVCREQKAPTEPGVVRALNRRLVSAHGLTMTVPHIVIHTRRSPLCIEPRAAGIAIPRTSALLS